MNTPTNPLISRIPRESAGPRAANRFAYQSSWALCKLLDLHESGAPYAIVCEHFDDVLIVDCLNNPQKIDVCQIKTDNTKAWTKQRLSVQKKTKSGPKHSILGKLYINYFEFSATDCRLFFVTNAPFKLNLQAEYDTNSSTISLAELNATDAEHIVATLASELGRNSNEIDLSRTTLNRCNMAHDGHNTYAIGHASQFLERVGLADSIRPKPFYDAIKQQIERISQIEDIPKDLKQLQTKSITREQFAEILDRMSAAKTTSFRNLADNILTQLRNEGMPFTESMEINKCLIEIQIERTDKSNLTMQSAIKELETIFTINQYTDIPETLINTMNDCVDNIDHQTRTNYEKTYGILSLRSLAAMIIYEYYNKQTQTN